MTEIMKTAEIKIDHATVKHAQTIGMVERSHQKLKQILKINVFADSPQWDRYVNIAVMAHNTTYHQSLKCAPSEVFHGRIPFNALDLKFGNPLKCETTETDITRLVDQVNEKYRQVNDNILQAYHKYKRYYDRKAQALSLKVNDFTFLLNPKLTTQSDKINFSDFKWEGPFKVIKVLTNFNYIIRKVGTFRTQCVHRMRLRPFTPNAPIPDIEDDSNRLFADPDAADDQALFNDQIPQYPHIEPVPEIVDQEEIDSEHGIIYYEHVRKLRDQTTPQPIPEGPPETCEQTYDNSAAYNDTHNESATEANESVTEHTTTIHNEHNHTTSRNNATRYNLRTEPQPKTYKDFLVHELRVKPALLKFRQDRPVN